MKRGFSRCVEGPSLRPPPGGVKAAQEGVPHAQEGLRHGVTMENVVLGNGSNEILELIGHAFIGEGDEVVIGEGAFIVYKLVALLFGKGRTWPGL